MTQPPPGRRIIRFGVYECDFHAGELHKNGIKVKLSEQPFRLLTILLDRRGELVTRQELRERLWTAEEFGEFDDGLNTAVNKVRAALDDSADNPRFIETIPRRGYRFIAPVEVESTASALLEQAAPAPALPGAASTFGSDSVPAVVLNRDRLRTLAAGVTAALLIAVSATFLWWHLYAHVTSAAEVHIRSIAVFPFDNFSGDPSQDFFAEGMTDELTTELAQVGSLRVTSRSTVLAYGGGRKPIRQIHDELGVDAIVEGSVARSGQSVRVDAHLVETSDDRQIWAQSFTEDEKDILALEDDVARAVAERIQVAIDPDVRERLVTSRPVNADAYEAYLHGISYMAQHSDTDLLKSLDYFKQAIAVDPTLAEAYAAEAEAYCYLGDYSVLPDSVVWPQAEMAAERSIALDDTIGKAHAARAFALWRYEWNWQTADTEFRRALFLTPNDADTHHLYGIFLATKGDFAGAEQQLRTARQLDPLSLIVSTNIGWLSYYQRDYTTAIMDYQKVLQADPQFFPAHDKLWIAYALQGDSENAGSELDLVFRSIHHTGLANQIAVSDKAGKAPARIRAEVLAYANSGYLTSYEKARFLAVAGEPQAALKALDEARRKRDSWLVYAGVEPAFDPLRSRAEFGDILTTVGLPNSTAHK
jgi:TolB-like protein/DNA-binding winged helix-turn-helix (wHTH) protein/Tfp pilus assembly protein PilF